MEPGAPEEKKDNWNDVTQKMTKWTYVTTGCLGLERMGERRISMEQQNTHLLSSRCGQRLWRQNGEIQISSIGGRICQGESSGERVSL